MSAPKEALAPAWKFVPVTVTVGLAPGAPELGDTLEIVGTTGKVTVALAVVPSAKLAVTVRLAPLLNGVGVKSDANTKKAPPSATPKLTDPFAALRSAVSRLAAAPRAQDGVAESVSQVPPLAGWRSSSRVTVRAPLPAWTLTWKVPSRAPSELKAAEPCPTLSRSLPRNTRLSTGGGRRSEERRVGKEGRPPGSATDTKQGPSAAAGAMARATES